VPMSYSRMMMSRSLFATGTTVLGIGILLLLIKLAALVIWYAAGAIALAGAIMVFLGWILGGARR